MPRKQAAIAALAVLATAAPAQADITISKAATQNMSCSAGVCAPTAAKAVLNAGDLQNDLSQFGNVRVMTTGSGVEANNIVVKAPFASPDSTSLTFEAHGTITVNAAVSIGAGTAEFEVQSDSLDAAHALSTGRNGYIAFGSLSDIFGINGGIFTLVGSLPGLASAVAANPGGAFALANSYDANADGTYSMAAVPTTLSGTFEGLGNVIANLKIYDFMETADYVALLSGVSATGTVRDIGVTNVSVTIQDYTFADAAALVGNNQGQIANAYATGTVNNSVYQPTGGLVADNSGTIDRSYAAVTVAAEGDAAVGGLVGDNTGQITRSFATGSAGSGNRYESAGVGGLVGLFEDGTIANSYATGAVTIAKGTAYHAGGLIGFEDGAQGQAPKVGTSYSTGTVPANRSRSKIAGGSIGISDSVANKSLYWDSTTSGTSVGVGAGSSKNVTGLTTQQLQSGLPSGFDPKVWAETSTINDGLPYLIANPPPN